MALRALGLRKARVDGPEFLFLEVWQGKELESGGQWLATGTGAESVL